MAEAFKKTQVNLELKLEINDQLTWGELYRFVDLAKTSGVDEDDPVGLAYDDQHEICGLSVSLAPDDLDPAARE